MRISRRIGFDAELVEAVDGPRLQLRPDLGRVGGHALQGVLGVPAAVDLHAAAFGGQVPDGVGQERRALCRSGGRPRQAQKPTGHDRNEEVNGGPDAGDVVVYELFLAGLGNEGQALPHSLPRILFLQCSQFPVEIGLAFPSSKSRLQASKSLHLGLGGNFILQLGKAFLPVQ